MATDTKLSYSIVTQEEHQVFNSLRDETSIIIKGGHKGLGVVAWNKEDYLKEAENSSVIRKHMKNYHRILLAP